MMIKLAAIAVISITLASCKVGSHITNMHSFATDLVYDDASNETPNIRMALSGCKPYSFSRDCFLSDSIYRLHYEINLALAPEDPVWFKRFLNQYMQIELGNVFFDEKVEPELLDVNEHTSWDMVGEHYFDWMQTHYIREYPQDYENVGYNGRDYDFSLTAYPVWEDDRFITYQIYLDDCPGSMHNREKDFCHTFEKTTGRLLGIEDFYTESEFDTVRRWLGKQLSDDKVEEKADINLDIIVPSHANLFMKEKYKGKFFPRPARVSEGIIFTYQPYEKGIGGIKIKQVLPYNK